MFQDPANKPQIDAFKSVAETHLTNWRLFVKARRRMIGEEMREAVDLFHMLLAYNEPGLPGFVQGVEIPGTDIHSLKNRENLLSRYFPFAVRQGMVNKFLPPDKLFFKFSAISLYHNVPVFLLFLENRNSKKLSLYEEKAKAIVNWLKATFGKTFYYQFIESRKGNVLSGNLEFEYPLFRKDIFMFFLLIDFLPLGIPYFFFLNEGFALDEIDPSWNRTINEFCFQKTCFFTDIFKRLPPELTEQFIEFFISYAYRKGSESLVESLIFSHIIKLETQRKGMIFNELKAHLNNLELFYHPIIFFYTFFRKFETDIPRDSLDKAFYLTLRRKKRFVFTGTEQILQNKELSFITPLLNEPSIYQLEDYKNFQRDEIRIKKNLKKVSEELRTASSEKIRAFSAINELKYNLSDQFIRQPAYPVNFSFIDYNSIVITYWQGVETDWELMLKGQNNASENIIRTESIEEIFLFAILNGIDWQKGVTLKNIGRHIRVKAEKLWSAIDTWLKGEEKVFIGVNYLAEDLPEDNNYFMSSVEDILNMGEQNQSLVKEITVFIKQDKFSQIIVKTFKVSNNISQVLSLLISNIENISSSYRISICYDIWYRPFLTKIENLFNNTIKPPFILRESGKFNLIAPLKVLSLSSFQEVLHEARNLGFSDFQMDKGSKGIHPYTIMSETKRKEKNQIFFLGNELREILVFYEGVFVDGYLPRNDDEIQEYLVSIFTYINSIGIQSQKEIVFEILTYKQKENGEGYFQDIKDNIEFASLSKQKQTIGLKMEDSRTFALKEGEILHTGANIKELIDHFTAGKLVKKYLIDFCISYPKDKLSIFNMLRIKFFIEKAISEALSR